jgi:hypothetical protein
MKGDHNWWPTDIEKEMHYEVQPNGTKIYNQLWFVVEVCTGCKKHRRLESGLE